MTVVVVTFVNVPHAAPEQPVPESVQVTPLLEESFWTDAEIPVDCEACTEVEGGLTVTAIGGGVAVTVIVALPDFVESAREVAVRVTVGGVGMVEGAV